MNPLHDYDCYFTFETVTPDALGKIREALADMEADLWESGVEFAYSGKDLGRRVIAAFRTLAEIVVNADGELRCEIENENSPDPLFEFYTIKDGLLWLRKGRIVRQGEITPILPGKTT